MNNRNLFSTIDAKRASEEVAGIVGSTLSGGNANDMYRTLDPLFKAETSADGQIIGASASFHRVVLSVKDGVPTYKTGVKHYTIFGNDITVEGSYYKGESGVEVFMPSSSGAEETISSYLDILKMMKEAQKFMLPIKVGNSLINEKLMNEDPAISPDIVPLVGVNYIKTLMTDDALKTTVYTYAKYLESDEQIYKVLLAIITGKTSDREDFTLDSTSISTVRQESSTMRNILGGVTSVGVPTGAGNGDIWTTKKAPVTNMGFIAGGKRPNETPASIGAGIRGNIVKKK